MSSMNKVAPKHSAPLNNNLKDLKPYKNNGAKIPNNLNIENKEQVTSEITEQAKALNTKETIKTDPSPSTPDNSSNEIGDKAQAVAKSLAKAPVLPVIIPKETKNLANKISDKEVDTKKIKDKDAPVHFIKKPAVIFIEGFSAFGISNGDGIKEMAENFPGAKKFDWTEHDKIVEEIKKHAPNEPVVLVGHSFGGDTAIEVANELNSVKNGFRAIDLVVSIDAVGMNKSIIPINVKSNLNFFGEGLIPFVHGDPTVARNTKYTDVTNELRADLHSKMEDNPEVQFQIFEKINQVLSSKGEEDIFIEISEKNQIKEILENIKNNL